MTDRVDSTTPTDRVDSTTFSDRATSTTSGDRATSTTLSYVLTLSIATMLVAGLILAGSTFVEDRREQVIRQELRVIGEHVASNVEQVDRYATASDATSLTEASIEQTFPPRVTGSTYNVILEEGSGDPKLLLNATSPSVDVVVNLTVQQPVASQSSAGGGPVVVECDTSVSPCELQIDNA